MTIGMLPEPDRPATTNRSRRIGRWLALAIVLVVCAGAVFARYSTARGDAASASATAVSALTMDTTARAPGGVRIKVRVLNTTGTPGLAKRATFLLRDFGYDVVDYDGDTKTPRTTTLIASHTGHADWAERLQRALGTGVIEARADTLRYVDFTVLLGSDWKPPAQPLRP